MGTGTLLPNGVHSSDDNSPAVVTAAQVNDQNNGTGENGAGSKAETLLLEVQINGEALPGIVRAERLAGGNLALALDVWHEARLLPPAGEPVALPDGRRGYMLESVPGLKYDLDRGRLVLQITAPAGAFTQASQTLSAEQAPPPKTPSPGVYLNYDFTATRSLDTSLNSYGAFLEAVAFTGAGSLVHGTVLRGDDNSREAVRTDTFWRTDFPGRMETLVLGDTIGSAGGWSRPVRYGGIRFGRDFSLAPGYIAYPMPTLQGSAALPSNIDILMNNQKQGSIAVNPGPFQLTNVPVITGAGELSMVVRDLRGVETVVTQSFYLSPSMLKPGLSDYSVEAGKFRKNYGLADNEYGPGFAAASYRYGLTPSLTAGTRVELQRDRQAAGIDLAGLVGSWGAVRGAAAWSHNKQKNGSPPVNGGRYLAAFERYTQGGGLSVQYEHFDAGFTQFGRLDNESRPRERAQANASLQLAPRVTAGMNFTRQKTWEGDRFSLIAGSLNMNFANMFITAYASKQLDGDKGWGAGLALVIPMEKQRSFTASTNRNDNGTTTSAVEVRQSEPTGPGWGWRVRASDLPSQRWQAGATFNSNFGQFTAEGNAGSNNNAFRFGANGAVGWLEGLPFATRRIDQGASFAVVRVSDFEGIPVYRDNQIAATTNARGRALVTGLLSYDRNELSVNPNDIPLDAEISDTKFIAVPYARSGIYVDFPAKRSRNALVTLHQSDGSPVPPGATVTLLSTNREFVVGKRGEAYLMGLGLDNRIAVQWRDGGCDLSFPVDPKAPVEPRIGPLICGGGK